MAIYIDADTIIKVAAILTACGVIGSIFVWIIRFFDRQGQQASEIEAIREEQKLMYQGVMACLKGLKEQGCNGPVTEALREMENYLNETAHGGRDT